MAWRAWCVSVGDRALNEPPRRLSDAELIKLRLDVETHMADFREFVRKDESFREKLVSAFAHDKSGRPDFIGHKQYHEAQIKAAEAQEAFWRDLKTEVAKKGTIGLLVIILGLIAAGAASKFGIGIK